MILDFPLIFTSKIIMKSKNNSVKIIELVQLFNILKLSLIHTNC